MTNAPFKVLCISDVGADVSVLLDLLKIAEQNVQSIWSFQLLDPLDIESALTTLPFSNIDVVLVNTCNVDDFQASLFRVLTTAEDIPVLVAGNSPDPGIALHAMRAGAQDYLQVDRINPEVLRRTISFAIERAQLAAEKRSLDLESAAAASAVRVIIENIPDGILLLNREGIIRLVNPAAKNILSRSEDELMGELFDFPVHDEGAAEIELHAGANTLHVEMRVTATEWQREEVYLVTLRDITNRLTGERLLKERNEQLHAAMEELTTTQQKVVQAAKLAALGTMVSGFGHEINNPLMGIMNYVSYARKKIEDTRIQELLIKAETEIDRVATIVRDMLTFTHTSSDAPVSFAPLQTLESVLTLIKADCNNNGIQLELSWQCNLPLAEGNPDYFRQTILNVIINARDALEGCENKKIQIRGREKSNQICIEITNSGPRIEDEYEHQIFNPFFTTKDVGRGTGLGLSVSQNQMLSSGGDLVLQHNEEGNVVFLVTLKREV